VFQKCAPCHSVEAGVNRLGPNLHGIVGRRWGSVEGFAYSPALRAADRRWDAASLDGYLADPKGFAPGTRMIFAGLKDAKDRQELIAYLATLP
jgi:cytochrome c